MYHACVSQFDIPNTYTFRQKKSVDVEVDLIRVGLLSATEDQEETARRDVTPESIAKDLDDFELA